MPLYDYCCEQGHVTEARAGYEQTSLPCPACGRRAGRVAVYEEQYISGETVAKGIRKASPAGDIKNKHGQYRVKLWQESQAEAAYAREKGVR